MRVVLACPLALVLVAAMFAAVKIGLWLVGVEVA